MVGLEGHTTQFLKKPQYKRRALFYEAIGLTSEAYMSRIGWLSETLLDRTAQFCKIVLLSGELRVIRPVRQLISLSSLTDFGGLSLCKEWLRL